uniref:DNA cytosine methyltransferase n=1 Tax=Pedobacter sp. TaxID=1411316 RepID=UPI001599B8B6|nr:DNA (cytosine-5-)-methyltransferase [Pedobacter sp.]QJS06266.1 DNA cytosine methyltransferase [Pedobacter sp.]
MSIKRKAIRYFDLFAGIGGFKVAADKLNTESFEMEHVAYCEIDPQARALYTKVHGTKSQIITDAKLIRTHKNESGELVEEFDLLFGGFPCQSFSNVGYRKGFDDERGQLFFTILDILDYYQPKYFVLENVQKLSTINKGNLLAEMKEALGDIGSGYNLHIWDLLASDYGLPQKRKRIFFCGIRKDISPELKLSQPPIVDLTQSRYPTTWHLLEKDSVNEKHFIPTKTRKTVLFKNPKWAGDVNIDNPIARPLTASMSKWHRANQDNYFSHTYINSSLPLQRPIVDLDKEPIRRITPLEGFRIQGFPDHFANSANEIGLAFSTQYRLIGNAVPVDLAWNVLKHFLNSYHESNK